MEEGNITLHDRLVAIQSELKAPKGQYNEFGKYKYRSAEDILEAVKPLLKEQGVTLTISDDIVMVGDRIYVKATATISDGKNIIQTVAFAREPASKKGADDSQITGATSSYSRKYALNGLLCIDDAKDADTDENHIETESRKKKSETRKAEKPECPEDVWHKLVKMEVLGVKTNSGKTGLQYLSANYKVDEITLVKFNNEVQMSRDAQEANENFLALDESKQNPKNRK